MPWYFYNKTGTLTGPKPVGVLSSGAIVGSLRPYTSPEPDGFKFCNGQALDRSVYLDLFQEIGTTFGVGDGFSTFNLPDFRGRMPRGIVNSASGIGTTGVPLGFGGSKTHSHTFSGHFHSLPTTLHDHTLDAHTHTMAHTHVTNSHRHTSGTLNLTVGTYAYSINNDSSHQRSAHDSHTHAGLSGYSGTYTGAGTSGASSDANTGFASNNLVNDANISGNTTSSLAEASSDVTQLPPYLTISFLIKI